MNRRQIRISMHRDRLPAPRNVPWALLERPRSFVAPLAPGSDPGVVVDGRSRRRWGVRPQGEEPPSRDRLEDPRAASARIRRLFDPVNGRVRVLERGLSHYLSQQVYPRVPGIRLPYDRLLRRGLTLSEGRVGLRGLAGPFEGTRVLLITDIHAGPFVSPRVLAGTFRRLLSLEPDLILLGGDLITSRADEFLRHRRAFSLLRAPLGTFAVLGNHDHYSGEQERLSRLCGEAGIELLHNRWTRLESEGAWLTLAGVDDLVAGDPDLDLALRDAPLPVVLLSHNPDLLFQAARRDVDLMLSGHTHAGQVRIPHLPVLVRQSRYRLDEGRFRAGRTELVVSRGLGVVGLPFRVACPPQAVLLELSREPR